MKIVILGAGIAGLAASYYIDRSKHEVLVLEKEKVPGGLCRRCTRQGFTFDVGVHVSFTENPVVKEHFQKAAAYTEFTKPLAMNSWKGYWIPHQVPYHLNKLPIATRMRCLVSMAASRFSRLEVRNYQDWSEASFGKFFTEHFVGKYTRKFWLHQPRELTTAWIKNRLEKPSLREAVIGAVADANMGQHYVKSFRYPANGGYAGFLSELVRSAKVILGFDVEQVDTARRIVKDKLGQEVAYDVLISTIPLPHLLSCIKDSDKQVLKAAKQLHYTSLKILTFGLKGKEHMLKESYWNYYYDLDIPFTRLFYMSKYSKNNAPTGFSCIQVEVPYSGGIDEKTLLPKVISKLIALKHIKSRRQIAFKDVLTVEYAYVIFDEDRERNLPAVNAYLESFGIILAGRFGLWQYLWSDQAFMSGKNAAEKANALQGTDGALLSSEPASAHQ